MTRKYSSSNVRSLMKPRVTSSITREFKFPPILITGFVYLSFLAPYLTWKQFSWMSLFLNYVNISDILSYSKALVIKFFPNAPIASSFPLSFSLRVTISSLKTFSPSYFLSILASKSMQSSFIFKIFFPDSSSSFCFSSYFYFILSISLSLSWISNFFRFITCSYSFSRPSEYSIFLN